MATEVIKYESNVILISDDRKERTSMTNGVKCVWSGKVTNGGDSIEMSWNFDVSELKKKGVESLSGRMKVRDEDGDFEPFEIEVNLTKLSNFIERTIPTKEKHIDYAISYEFALIPCYMSQVSYDEMFLPSDKTDAILVIEGNKLHVNKNYLSIHSDFFRALFSLNFKEGQMDEIPIRDVTFDDMAMLLSMINPMNSFPNDETVEKLLELADRFLMPFVVRQVQHHLLYISKIGNDKLMWMADKYGMEQLLKKTIHEINSVEKVKKIRSSEKYDQMSDKTKLVIFDRSLELA